MSSGLFSDFDRLGAPVAVVAPGGALVDCNPALAALAGSAPPDLRGRPLWEALRLDEADAGRLERILVDLATVPRAEAIEVRLRRSSGEPRSYALSLSVVHADRSGAPQIVVVAMDVTPVLSRRESDLARLRGLLEQAPDGIFTADIDGRYTDVNQAGCDLLGYTREEIIGKTINDLIPPDQAPKLVEAREHLLRGETHVADWELQRKDGKYVPVEVSAKILPDGRWQGLVRDMSERKALERSLREANADLSRAQAVARVGSWRLEVGTGELLWSDETHHIFGTLPGSKVTYERFIDCVHPEDRPYVRQRWDAALRGEPYDLEHRIVVGDQVKWVHERADLEFSPTGTLLGGVGVVQDITAQKAITLEQRLWQERLNAIIAIAADAIISIDDDQRIVMYNEGAEKIFLWKQKEVLGQPLDVLIPPRFRESHRRAVRRFADEPEITRAMGHRGASISGLRKGGEEFAAEAAISKTTIGGSRFFTVTLRDISERRRWEDALRLSEERLRVSLQAAPVVVFNQDLQLRYTWFYNPRFPSEAERILGKTDPELFPPEEADELSRLKRAVLASGTGAHQVVRTTIDSEVRYHDLTVEPMRDASGRVVGITCAAWDVTAQRRAEDEQRFLARAGSVLMTASPNVEATLAELGRLAVEELSDWFLIDLVEAQEVRRLVVISGDRSKRPLAAALEEIPLNRERPHLTFEPLHDRRSMLVSQVTQDYLRRVSQNPEHEKLLRALNLRSIIAVPLVARGKLLGAFALMSSDPSRVYGERDLRFAEDLARLAALAVDNAQLYQSTQRAIAARDGVLGIIAHDLRNPLNVVLTQSELVRRRSGDVDERNRRSLEAIGRAARRMNRLIQDMLDVAKLEAGPLAIERAPVATRGLLDEAYETQRDEAAKAGLQITLDADPVLPSVLGDRDRLLQVLENLITNSVKFTEEGGRIVIGAGERSGHVLFWVTDTGVGISADQLAHLFDRFWQARSTDRRGAGLGLSIVKGIVESHGGKIWVDSQLGRGTTFFFTIPTAAPLHAELPGAAPA